MKNRGTGVACAPRSRSERALGGTEDVDCVPCGNGTTGAPGPENKMSKKNIDEQVAEAVENVRLAFDILTKARNKYNRCSKPESVELARTAMHRAETLYRFASSERDRLVNVRNALVAAKAKGAS